VYKNATCSYAVTGTGKPNSSVTFSKEVGTITRT